MTCILTGLAISFCISPTSFAALKLIEITSKGPVKALPTEVIPISYRVQNPDTAEMNFKVEFEIPEGWSIVSGDGLVAVPAKSSTMRIASFKIPSDASAGSFRIVALLESAKTSKAVDTSEIEIEILPSPKIELFLNGSAKTQLLAGEKFSLEFIVQNTGNVPLLVDLTLKSIDPAKATTKTPSLLLGLGQKGTVPVEVETTDSIDRLEDAILILSAKATQVFNGEIACAKSFSYRFTVYPKSSAKVDKYRRLPGEISFRGIIENRNETQTSSQVEIGVKGPLNDQETDEIDLLYRGPSPGRNIIFFTKDESAHLAYKTKNYGIFLGDGYFDLSPLIDMSRSGRGVELSGNIDDFGMETFYARTPRGQSTEEAYGLDLNYTFQDDNKISFNFLDTAVGANHSVYLDGREIMGIRGQFGNPDESNIDVEYAWGGFDNRDMNDDAFKVDVRCHKEDLDFRFRRIDAGDNFPGHYRSQKSNEISGSIPLGENFDLSGNWRQQRRNFGDGFSGATIDDRFYRIGASYNAPNRGTITLDYIDQTRRDTFETSRFDNTERYWRLGASLMVGDLTLGGRLELGDNEDRVDDATVMHLSQLGMLSWRINEHLFLSGFADYRRGDFLNIYRHNSLRTGLTFRFNPTKSTYLSSGLNCEVERQMMRRWNFPISFKHTFADGDELEIRARHSIRSRGSRHDDDTAVMVEYSIPLSIPIERRRDIGTIEGTIRDMEKGGIGIKDMLIRVENKAALTDSEGKYAIKGIGIGKHFVTIENQNLGENRITIPRIPVNVDMTGGTIKLDFDVVTASNINGRVFIPSGKEDIAEKNLADIIIELTGQDNVERTLTDESGRFTYDCINPGVYKLTVDNSRIPKHYHLEQELYEFELKPGETLDLNIKVVEDRVKVEIIQSGELSTE